MIHALVQKRLGQFQLSAEIEDGGFICLAGRNGSGKSCFLRSVAGHIPLDAGYVRVGDVDVTRVPVERRGIVMVTPGSSLPHLEVDAHLRWGAKVRKIRLDEARVTRIKSELGIDSTGRVASLSLGTRERLSLATALLSSPKAILVDEAFSNLHERREFIASYGKLAHEAGIDVIFSTQDEADSSLAEHTYAISGGKTEKRS